MGLAELHRAVGIVELQESVRRRLRHGASLDDVEHEIIAPSPLDENQRMALRLFAWSELPQRRRRSQARLLTEFTDAQAKP
jgi:hypothetical protein